MENDILKERRKKDGFKLTMPALYSTERLKKKGRQVRRRTYTYYTFHTCACAQEDTRGGTRGQQFVR